MRQFSLSPEEYQIFAEALFQRRSVQAAAMGCMLFCGLRVGEVVRLQWQDVFADGVCREYLYVRAPTTKNKRARTLPIPLVLQDLLLRHYRDCERELGRAPDGFFPLFPGTDEEPWSIRWVRRFTVAQGKLVLRKQISPHTLRHTFATRILRASNMRVAQTALGHASIATTQLYTHVQASELAAAAARAFSRENQAAAGPDLDSEVYLLKRKEHSEEKTEIPGGWYVHARYR